MRKTRAIRAAVASLAVSVAVTAGLAIAPASADAAVGQPLTGAMCSGDLCVQVYYDTSVNTFGTIIVREWAWKSTFYGHFELQVPEVGSPYNSPQNSNVAGNPGHYFYVPNNNGTFTAHAWFYNGSNWEDLGTVSFNGAVF